MLSFRLFAFSIFLLSCVHRTSEGFSKIYKAWEGRSEKEVVERFGYPENKHTSPEGNRVYEYALSSSYYFDSYPYRRSFFPSHSHVYRVYCTLWVELKDSKVFKVMWKGNDCLAKE